MTSGIEIGDLFWDKHPCWDDGSKTVDLCYLVLSADQGQLNGVLCYRCACFMWARGGYCGAHDRNFTADEVLKMAKIGNIAQIKHFDSGKPGP